MLRFVLGALVINLLPLLAFGLWRHRVARWPLPGLWWLSLGVAALVATLQLARVTL
ncbi:MAG: hypothetical protein OHK0048_24780 [Rhodoferax sp.]